MKIEIERQTLIDLIKKALELNISNCQFMKKLYKSDKNVVKTLNKSIRSSEKSLNNVSLIKHIEILRALYGDIIGKYSNELLLSGTLVMSKKTQYFDKTEKGFKEFVELTEQNKKMYQEKLKEQEESRKAIEKAKEQGKKVEYMIDPVTKKLKPIILEGENNNA